MTHARVALVGLIAGLTAMPLPAAQPVPVAAAVAAVEPSPLSTVQRKALIDAISKALDEQYVFPDKVPAIVAKLRAADRAGRYAGLSQEAMAMAMTADIHAVVQDAHLQVT